MISAPHAGIISDLQIKANDSVDGSDLICKIVQAAGAGDAPAATPEK